MARRRVSRQLKQELEELVDSYSVAEVVEGLAAYSADLAADDDLPEANDWDRLAKIFDWVSGKLSDLGLD